MQETPGEIKAQHAGRLYEAVYMGQSKSLTAGETYPIYISQIVDGCPVVVSLSSTSLVYAYSSLDIMKKCWDVLKEVEL